MVAVSIVRKARNSLGTSVRFALETSRDVLKQTPQKIRNWRRLSISEVAQRPRLSRGPLESSWLTMKSFVSSESNRPLIVMGIMVVCALLIAVVFAPHARAAAESMSIGDRMSMTRSSFVDPIVRAWTRIGLALRSIPIPQKVLEPLRNVFRRVNFTLPDIRMELPSISESAAFKAVEGAINRTGEWISSSGKAVIGLLQKVLSYPAEYFGAVGGSIASYAVRAGQKVSSVLGHVTDRSRFVSKDEFARALEDLKSLRGDQDIEEQIRQFILDEKAKLQSAIAKGREKQAQLKEAALQELRERSEKASSSIDRVRGEFFRVAGDVQLKQLGFLRDLKGGLTAAFDVPKDKTQEATALIVSEMDKVSTNVSESIKSISDKVSEIIAAEEAEIKEELLKTRKKASASSNSVVEEYLAKKQRTEDGLKRVRYSVQRILSSWQQRQIKRVEDISKGLVRTLGRARSRPRYVSRGELDNAVKELKESLSLDEIEDQVIRVIQDEIRKINAKISPRQRLTREEMGQEVFERVIADKGGRPDFALQSAGAYVVRTSPSYAYQLVTAFKERALTLLGRYKADFVMGFPNSPSMAITPDIALGKCWGFQGQASNITIHLARPAIVDAFTVEHVHRSVAFSLASAPRSIRIYGSPADRARLNDSTEAIEYFFGEIEYSISELDSHMQYFEVPDELKVLLPSRAVRVQIMDNHGGDFTCLYRIRVHGVDV
mmetsp:Transcript_18376/g.73728  ORF Transcript_18376/g.73728 Transcript_18376/m.73728 type:complete len:719 (-) Transcript_18376:515-2671(-)